MTQPNPPSLDTLRSLSDKINRFTGMYRELARDVWEGAPDEISNHLPSHLLCREEARRNALDARKWRLSQGEKTAEVLDTEAWWAGKTASIKEL